MINSSTFEIAWNVGLDKSQATRIYKICYTVENAVKSHLDCSEFYWQFLSSENKMSGSNITGTIKLPNGITDIEKLHIWGHGDLSGNTERTSTNTVKFSMNNIYSNTMLEIRVVSEDNVFKSNNKTYKSKLNEIMSEEAKFANEANQERFLAKMIIFVIAIIIFIVFVIYLIKIKKYIEAGKELDLMKYPENEIKYFRDIPDEKNATPARAAYLYYFGNTKSLFDGYTSSIFSATILQLTLKKYITLEAINKKNIKIFITNSDGLESLTSEERMIYDFIVKQCDKKTNSIDTASLEKYARKNYDEFIYLMNDVCLETTIYESEKGAIDKKRYNSVKKWNSKVSLYSTEIMLLIMLLIVVLTNFSIMFSTIVLSLLIALLSIIIIESVICAILCNKNSKKISALSENAYEESNQWKGLENYMSDFSLLKDREVPDLILWEKYLVYATVFGISKKVINQLVEVYPQLNSLDTYNSGAYTYLYMASDSRLNGLHCLDNTFSNICRVANSAYNSAHSSSSGSGGGFSSGGGGRWRWRKLRWKMTYNVINMPNMKL